MRLDNFLDSASTALKICGVRCVEDARGLVELGVPAVGFNFWPNSKRYLEPGKGEWMKELGGEILRVGVFVNEKSDLPFRLVGEGMIDVVQLHGDEGPEVTSAFAAAGIPVIRAIGVRSVDDFAEAGEHEASAILLDAHAPRVFGGTGVSFDWGLAREFKDRFPELPMILAGGINAENAAEAVADVAPVALDVASGGESTPGVKDFEKIRKLMAACGGGR